MAKKNTKEPEKRARVSREYRYFVFNEDAALVNSIDKKDALEFLAKSNGSEHLVIKGYTIVAKQTIKVSF